MTDDALRSLLASADRGARELLAATARADMAEAEAAAWRDVALDLAGRLGVVAIGRCTPQELMRAVDRRAARRRQRARQVAR